MISNLSTTLCFKFPKGILPFLILIIGFCTSCKTNKAEPSDSKASFDSISNDIPVYDFDELEPLLYTTSNKTYLINFWAMWCAPCIKELPYIQEFADKHPDIEVLLVSMDFTTDIETKLKPFLEKRNITNKVILLDDPDANTWIDKIDPNWSGAIPFTIIFNKDERIFYERSFEDLNDLENEYNKNFI